MRDQTSIFMIIDNTDCACACQLDQVAGEKDRFCGFARTGATGWCGYCLQETGSEYNRASSGGAASDRFPNRRVGGLTVELEKWKLLSASSTAPSTRWRKGPFQIAPSIIVGNSPSMKQSSATRDPYLQFAIAARSNWDLNWCRDEIQCGRSPLGLAFACIQCSARSFVPRHGPVETGSVRSPLLPRRWRDRADPVPAGSRERTDDGTVPRMQAEVEECSERLHRD